MNGYSQAPHTVLEEVYRDPKVPARVRVRIFLVRIICGYGSNRKAGGAHIARSHIAKETRLSERTVTRVMKRLMAEGKVLRGNQPSPGQATFYSLEENPENWILKPEVNAANVEKTEDTIDVSRGKVGEGGESQLRETLKMSLERETSRCPVTGDTKDVPLIKKTLKERRGEKEKPTSPLTASPLVELIREELGLEELSPGDRAEVERIRSQFSSYSTQELFHSFRNSYGVMETPNKSRAVNEWAKNVGRLLPPKPMEMKRVG